MTTAEYVGEIRREGIEDITYTVTYLGEPVLPSYEDEANGEGWASKLKSAWPYLAGGSCFLAAGGLGNTPMAFTPTGEAAAGGPRTPCRKTILKKERRTRANETDKKASMLRFGDTFSDIHRQCRNGPILLKRTIRRSIIHRPSYEEIYGSLYNYGGPNIVDYQIPELEYGTFSTTQTGIMEKALLPGLQDSVSTASGGGYGISGGAYGISESIAALPELPEVLPDFQNQQYQPPAYTSVEGMEREDGSIGTIQIPSLDISMKLWEGETNASMAKGRGWGIIPRPSAWDGNVGVCGHNRGAKYVIGSIKDLDIGDTITYTTIYGHTDLCCRDCRDHRQH